MTGLSLIILVCHCIIWLVAGTCEITTTEQLMALVNDTYPVCRNLDFTSELLICDRDENDTCGQPCPDGAWNRTCYPTMTPFYQRHFTCVCKPSFTGDVAVTSWSGWKEISPPAGRSYFGRQLTMEGECIALELNMVWRSVVSGYKLPDSVFSASHLLSVSYAAYKARVDNYWTDFACAWVAPATPGPYLEIALPRSYKIIGMYFMKAACGLVPKIISVTTGPDGSSWEDVVIEENISAQIVVYKTAFVSFPGVYTTRYWRIIILNSVDSPTVKCDLVTIAI